jgi:hypothetical protein
MCRSAGSYGIHETPAFALIQISRLSRPDWRLSARVELSEEFRKIHAMQSTSIGVEQFNCELRMG